MVRREPGFVQLFLYDMANFNKLHRNVAGDQEKDKNELDPSKTLTLANSMFYV